VKVREKYIIFVIDFDGDLEQAGIRTPLIGRENLLQAATRFMLNYPDDSDGNAMFAALNLQEKLTKMGVDAEVAAISGERDFANAVVKLEREIRQVLSTSDYVAAIAVVDSPTDEEGVRILSRLIPVTAVYRVVVKQQRGVEQTAMLLKHYIAKAVKDAEWRRYFVGVPALIALLVMVLNLISVFVSSITASLIYNGVGAAIAVLMILYGFDALHTMQRVLRNYPATFVVTLASILTLTVLAVVLPMYYTYWSYIVTAPILTLLLEDVYRNKIVRVNTVLLLVVSISFVRFVIPSIIVVNLWDIASFVITMAISLVLWYVLSRARPQISLSRQGRA